MAPYLFRERPQSEFLTKKESKYERKNRNERNFRKEKDRLYSEYNRKMKDKQKKEDEFNNLYNQKNDLNNQKNYYMNEKKKINDKIEKMNLEISLVIIDLKNISYEKGEDNVMLEPPREPKEPLFDKLLIEEILLSGSFIGIIVFIVWIILIRIINLDEMVARGYVMALMVFMQNIHVFNCRSEKNSIMTIKPFSNWLLPFSVVGATLLQILIM